MSIKILLVDDHRMFREALGHTLKTFSPEIEVVGEAGSATEALPMIEQCVPDMLLLDISLPDRSGIDFARELHATRPALAILALSGYADRTFVNEMLKAGARGYVIKSAGADELIRAIQTVAGGQRFLSPEITLHVLPAASPGGPPPLSVLGRRERDVLRLLARGLRSAEISEALGIAVGTVNVHRRNIKQKLGIWSTAELTRYAIREGLLAV